MDWRLLLGTFTLIFFAELGDKTQLAAMAAAAGNKSIWSVFCGASAALVLSTLIAVLLGSTLPKYAPESVIKTIAGVLFIGFGVFFLWSAVGARRVEALPAEPLPAKLAEVRPGLLNRFIINAAVRFETAAAEDYAALAGKVRIPELRSLFTAVATEERRHLARVEELAGAHVEPSPKAGESTAGKSRVEELPRFLWADGALLDREMEILAAAMRQEKAKAEFYGALADSALIPSLKTAFRALAEEEREHLRRLDSAECEMKNGKQEIENEKGKTDN